MIVLLLLAAALCGVEYASRRRRKSVSKTATTDDEQEHDVEALSGPGWALIALNPGSELRVVDLDDPTVDPTTDIALALSDRDVN